MCSIQNISLLLLLELKALIELRLAVLAFGQEVEAYATDVLLRSKVFGTFHLVALNFEFHQSPGVEPHLVAIAQMACDDGRQAHHHTEDVALGGAQTFGYFFQNLFAVHLFMVYGLGLVLAEGLQRGLGFFDDFVFHIL